MNNITKKSATYQRLVDYEADKLDAFAAKCCRIILYIFVTVTICNELNIFIMDKPTVRMLGAMTVLMMLPPTITLKYTHDRIRWRYYISSTLAVLVGVLYTFLSYHSVIMFVFPLTLMATYGDEKLKRYTNILVMFSMFCAHVISVDYSVVFDDPLIHPVDETMTPLFASMVYGFVPRFIVYLGYITILNFITKRNADILSRMVDSAQTLHDSQQELIRQFSSISESKSGQTGKHVRRVALLTDTFAKHLDIIDERDDLSTASMMHDIGKLLIDEKIIEKPARLTDEEFAQVKKHTDYGFKLLKNSPGRIMEIAREIALDHHERWDGKGYVGKKGEEINYYARIVSIVDVFDALTSVRSYKPAWTCDDAYKEIISQSGTQFDPELIEVFKSCYPEFKEIVQSLPDSDDPSDDYDGE